MGPINLSCVFLFVSWILALCNGDPKLLIANLHDVQIVQVSRSQRHLLNSSTIIVDLDDGVVLDFAYEEGIIFWSDVAQEVIKRVSIHDTRHHVTVASTDLESPVGLAVDWIGKKLYWTDSGAHRIEVSDWDGHGRKVLFWQHLDQPRAIALDPENGYMYWTDWGEMPKIEKAGMDGSEGTRSVLIDTDIEWPNGLTIDYQDSKIYWADAKLHFIHSCDFDGSNRKSVFEEETSNPFALTLHGSQLYWTDWNTHSIHSCDKRTGADKFMLKDKDLSPQDVHAFERNRQPKDDLSNIGGQNMCGSNNGGCSHLCLLSPIHPYYVCACPTGIRLMEDNHTCAKGPEKMIFLACRYDIRQISLDMPDYTDLVRPLKGMKYATALDYDINTGFIYWTDGKVKTIQRAKLDGTEQEVIADQDVDRPDGIAIDWIANNLYWTDAGTNRIEVSRLNGTSRKVILSYKVDKPRAICLDPAAGSMYWSDWGPKQRAIERAFLDGSHREVIVQTNLKWPNGLAIDLADRRLFWGDADTDRIEVCDLDGKNRKTLVSEKLLHIFGFSLLGDYIYWTDWLTRSLERVNKYTGGNRTFILDNLPNMMGLRAVDIHRAKDTNTCGVNNGNCSHLCLYRPPPYGHVCACPMGSELQADGKTCVVPESFLVFSSGSDIRRISLESNKLNNEPIPIQGVQKAQAIDFDINDNRIYWTDTDLKQISCAFMNGSSLKHIIQFGLSYPEGMVVDWVAHNIYWADTGKNRIEVARLDGSSRKVLVWRNLIEPRALALDPTQGHMYWTVWGKEPMLERANLDGTNRKVIISGIGHVQDLTIDYVDRRLYWTDINDHSIKSSDMNGKDMRKIAQSQVERPMGISQYQDFVYWTDITRRSIERANKTDGSKHKVIMHDVGPMDILIFHPSRQAGGNACEENNGNCSHLCIAHPLVDSNNQTRRTRHCSCPTQYTLNKDQHTCTAPKRYLLLSTRNATIRLVMDSDNTVDNPEVVLPINNMKNIKALAYDPVGEFIYWVEKKAFKIADNRTKPSVTSENAGRSFKQRIFRAHDNGTRVSVVVNNPGDDIVVQPYDIAIDPYARTLYWTCLVNNVINVTPIDMSKTHIGVIMTAPKRFKPRSIVLYAEIGYMFYTNMLSSPRIEKALMDGSNPTVIIKNGLEHPQSLTIDKRENKLYWADSQLNRIEMSDLTGGYRTVLVDGNVGNPKGLAIYGKFLYWLDKDSNIVERIHKKKGNRRLWVRGRITGLSDLISVEHSINARWHPCYNNISGCSHMCYIIEKNTSQCACPVGLTLKRDKKSCIEPPTCASDEFKCNNGDCIPLVWRCDYRPECGDNSDEENCDACKPSEFKCANGVCINRRKYCDQHNDCLDGSDEKNCQPVKPNGQTVNPTPESEGGSKTSKDYTIAIVVVIVFLLVVVILFLVCRHKSNDYDNTTTEEDIMMVKKPLNTPVGDMGEDFSPHNSMTRGKSIISGISGESGSCPPYYDRNHVTGASSSSSVVTQYPKETLNPPPSPVTDRSLYKEQQSRDVYMSLNSLSTFQRSGPAHGQRRRNHHHHRRHHHHHHHHHHNIPPPPTTPCSTDVCEDSEPYHQHVHHVSPVHTSTPATTNNKHSGRRSRSRSSNAKKLKYRVQDDSIIGLNYDSDPYPPPPTPRSHYFSDDMSCPPSPSTERSYFNPYPPPPSPVATSDC